MGRNVLYGDGHITSFEGNGDVAIVVDCATGQLYTVTFLEG